MVYIVVYIINFIILQLHINFKPRNFEINKVIYHSTSQMDSMNNIKHKVKCTFGLGGLKLISI